jgi:uncharacterized protein YycO
VTRFKRYTSLDNWIIEPVLMCGAESERRIRAWCHAHVGMPYGWETIFAIATQLRTVKDVPTTAICSEICKRALLSEHILHDTADPVVTDPGSLLKEIRAWNSAMLTGRYARFER